MKADEALEMMAKLEKYYWGKISDDTVPSKEWIDLVISLNNAIEELATDTNALDKWNRESRLRRWT